MTDHINPTPQGLDSLRDYIRPFIRHLDHQDVALDQIMSAIATHIEDKMIAYQHSLDKDYKAELDSEKTKARIAQVEELRSEQADFIKAQSGHIRNNNRWPHTRGAGDQAKNVLAWLDRRLETLKATLEKGGYE